MFAPDIEYETLRDKLNLTNLSQNDITFAESDIASMTYIVRRQDVSDAYDNTPKVKFICL